MLGQYVNVAGHRVLTVGAVLRVDVVIVAVMPMVGYVRGFYALAGETAHIPEHGVCRTSAEYVQSSNGGSDCERSSMVAMSFRST